MECYEREDPCLKYNIIDSTTGEKIGFATFVELMAQTLVDDGVCFFPRHELYSISHDSLTGTNTLQFSNGVFASVSDDLILNVPQRPLLQILRKSSIPFNVPEEEEEVIDAIHSVQSGNDYFLTILLFLIYLQICSLFTNLNLLFSQRW